MRLTGHRLLVVEDDPNASEITCAILRSRGDSPRAVATVEDALAAIEEEEFCGFVLDQGLPLNLTDPKPFISGGERVTIAARQSDPRRTPDGAAHVTPILALTLHSKEPRFVAGLFKLRIDAFVEKDVCDRVEYFCAEVREMLAKAGRGDHANCAALSRRASGGGAPGATGAGGEGTTCAVRLAIDGRVTRSGRTAIVINGTPREMMVNRFVVLLRLVVARERSIEAWSSKVALGIEREEPQHDHPDPRAVPRARPRRLRGPRRGQARQLPTEPGDRRRADRLRRARPSSRSRGRARRSGATPSAIRGASAATLEAPSHRR